MRQSIAIISSVMATLLMVGCGGSGSSDSSSNSSAPAGGTTSVATFIDSPVSGLGFDTSSESNLTDSNGNFRYTEGESVTFHIGNLYLGSAKPVNGKITPLDLINSNNISDTKVVRMLQTLQTLDSDGDPTNGITIDPSVTATLKGQSRVDMSTATDAAILNMIGKHAFSVSTARAQSNFTPSAPSNANKGYTPTQPTTPPVTDIGNTGKYTLVAWNDLGMHCMDGNDYSVFSILPPYNNLHAHLISKDATSGKSVTSGVTLTYEAVADPSGSINTTSVTKTNFWDWVLAIFGGKPADNRGLNMSGGAANPAPSLTPAGMTYNAANSWWEAEGIPVTPYDDKGVKNYYPMVKVVAKDSGGAIIATTKVTLPVSDEMNCAACHASTSNYAAAKPSAGWVNNTANVERDWKQNILKLHDDKFPTAIATANMAATYTKGSLLATANAGQPVLCAACHKSNALGTSLKTGIKPLTEALHTKHASVIDPVTNKTMDSATNRDSCYRCHPGSATACLRGAMGKAKTASGANAMDCQSCHGKLTNVGTAGREGWLQQPNCQQCHDRNGSATAGFARFTSVFSSGTTLRTTVDSKFATNANTPGTGFSLYRFSKGHGNLQCEACHGATHAEYPSSHTNDNVQSLALQGHIGTIGECKTCHTTIPTTVSGGPHGLHPVGSTTWYKDHRNAAKSAGATSAKGTDACAACHGTDYRGTVLSKTAQARTISGKTFTAGEQVSCYKCHSGPNP
jgi:hypothetical protein